MITRFRHAPARRAIAALAIGALLLSACGGTPAGTIAPSAGTGNQQLNPGSPPAGNANPFASIHITIPVASGAPVTGHVGDALTFYTYGSDEVDATLVKVFDPATPTSSTTEAVPAGYRWVGAEVTMNNHSSDPQGESFVLDAIASSGTILTTDDVAGNLSYPINAFQGCTRTSDSEQDPHLSTHCVAFVVPNGQNLTQVGVKVGGVEIYMGLVPNDQATWSIP